MDESQTEIYNQIDDILYHEWNPIGVNGLPRDEYQCYTPNVFNLKIHGADKIKIAEHLYQIESVNMGLTGNREICNEIAQKIIEI